MTVKTTLLEQLLSCSATILYNIARCENGYNSLDEISLKMYIFRIFYRNLQF